MRDLNTRGSETEATDWILCKRLAHLRGWCLSDGSLERNEAFIRLNPHQKGKAGPERSLWSVYTLCGCFYAFGYSLYPRKHNVNAFLMHG